MSLDRGVALRWQVTGPVIVLVLVVGAVAYYFTERVLKARVMDDFDQALLAQTRVLATLTFIEPPAPEEGELEPFVELDFAGEFMPEFERDKNPSYFQLWLADGSVLERSDMLGRNDLPNPDDLSLDDSDVMDLTLIDGRKGRAGSLIFLPQLSERWESESSRRTQAFRERYPELEIDRVAVTLAVPRDQLDGTIFFYRMSLALGIFGMASVVSLAVPFLVRRGHQPISALSSRLDTIDSAKLDARLPIKGIPDELAPISHNVNKLLGRLEAAFDRERLFSRNVAHELRTPIAELRSVGDVGAQWHDDPQMLGTFFKGLAELATRMDQIVTNLLMIARHETGQFEPESIPLDLSEAAESVRRRLAPQAEKVAKRIDIHTPASSRPVCLADATVVDLVLTNLVSNGLQHGDGDAIAIEIAEVAGGHALVVSNSAAPFTDRELETMFDRFWRKDDARSGGRNIGLGLSLVRTLCEAAGWRISADYGEGQLVMTIRGLQTAN